ncbi:unnamed protein product [Brassica rapa subsp. trilocularis]
MAMFHAQPLLLLLIVSLFFLPAALGATKFRKCNPDRNSPVEVKTLRISPEPPVESSTNGNITVIGDSSIEISDGATVSIIVAPKRSDRRSYSLCDLVACPVAPGPIEFTVPNVFTKEELDVMGNKTYLVRISIIMPEHQKEPVMCVKFSCAIREMFPSRQAIE